MTSYIHSESNLHEKDLVESLFCMKTHIVTPHLNCLNETVPMRGHNIRFRREIRKIIIKYSLLSRALHGYQANLIYRLIEISLDVTRSIGRDKRS